MFPKPRSRLFHAIFLATVSLSSVNAAESDKEDGLMETVVVTASRYPQTLLEVPSSIAVVDERSMREQGVRFIGDELLTLPGVSVSQADQGTYTGITVRGARNEHQNDTFVAMLDGVPIVTIDDEVDLEQIPFIAIERVEVLRGPTSALYGRGGVAGAVNYITRSPSAEAEGEITLSMGDDAYRRG